jgi:hypothetical protein
MSRSDEFASRCQSGFKRCKRNVDAVAPEKNEIQPKINGLHEELEIISQKM